MYIVHKKYMMALYMEKTFFFTVHKILKLFEDVHITNINVILYLLNSTKYTIWIGVATHHQDVFKGRNENVIRNCIQ